MTAAAKLPGAVRRFIAQDMHVVKGWLKAPDATLIALVDIWQRANGVEGDLCEIGIYHGRCLALLGLLLRPGEIAFGVDVFDMPGEHKAFRGDEVSVRANLARFCRDARCELIPKSSLQLTATDLRSSTAASARIRLFCIDGDHERAFAEHDFRFAESVLADGGVIIVDDYFNRRWPGVSEAINAVFATGETALKPFAIGQAKVLFARAAFTDGYRASLERDWPSLTRTMFNAPVAVVSLPTTPQRIRAALIARLGGARRLIARRRTAMPDWLGATKPGISTGDSA